MPLHFKRLFTTALCFLLAVGMRIPSAQRYGYLSDGQIQQRIDRLVNRNPLFTKKTCSTSNLYNYLEIGVSSNTSLNAVIICNIHAREIVTAEMCLNWIQNLKHNSSVFSSYFTRVFYIANANRQAFIDHQNQCIRKNQNNVDTNRNFPTDFDHWKARDDNQTYGGKSPLDQPLSKCLNQLFTERVPDLYVDLHTGMNGTVFYQEGDNNEEELSLINEINEQVCNNELKITTLTKDGQTINGHIFADIKVRLHVPFSFLIQTYKGNDLNDCFTLFNPTEPSKEFLIQRYEKILNSIFEKVKANQQN